jgi:hypothetical protein
MTGPEHYTRAEQLLREVRDGHQEGTDVAAIIAAAQVHATLALVAAQAPTVSAMAAMKLETEPAVAYVYRAAWGMTPLGTYTNAEAARMHCEADATNHSPEYEGRVFDWLGDESEPDAPYELVVGPDDDEQTTDYTVTRITVDSEYDAEADA